MIMDEVAAVLRWHILQWGTLHLAIWFDPNLIPRSSECDRGVCPDEKEGTALSLRLHLVETRITRIRRDQSPSMRLSSTINRRAAFERELGPNAPVEDMAMGIYGVGSITDK